MQVIQLVDKNSILEKFKEFAHSIAESEYDEKPSPFSVYYKMYEIVMNESLYTNLDLGDS